MSSVHLTSSNIENVKASQIKAKWDAKGTRILRYYIDINHKVLDLHKELSAPELDILQNKVDALLAAWDKKYELHLAFRKQLSGKALADQMTIDAEAKRDRYRSILLQTLNVDDTVSWDSLKDHTKFTRQSFPTPKPTPPILPRPLDKPPEPVISFFQSLLGQRRRIEADYERDMRHYENQAQAQSARSLNEVNEFQAKVARWEEERKAWEFEQDEFSRAFAERQAETNLAVDALKISWQSGHSEAICEHASIVLESSDYGDLFQKSFDVAYLREGKVLLLEYQLPTPDDLPCAKTVRFVATTGELKETGISEKERKDLYDEACYQICLRSIHELFEADTFGHIEQVVFNGIAEYIEKSSGNQVSAIIMSLMVNRAEFTQLNLKRIDPKACFKSLKGVSAASLAGLAAVPPVMKMDKTDRRFIDARAISLESDGTTNLAAMDWEDFEHLVRELFEKEFLSRGGEVKVTQSSSDGGVDAVAFDPDPISGGKIVIQAKRYTKTVGVAAVRDLYGTTLSEGASKGILVTTADYGPDAYKFANGKPITLLTGANLLHLLEKHGVRAKIDLRAAREEAGLSGSTKR